MEPNSTTYTSDLLFDPPLNRGIYGEGYRE